MTRLSLRRTAAAGIVALCTTAALAGCGSSESPTSTTGATPTTAVPAKAKNADQLMSRVAAAVKAKSTVHVSRKSAAQNADGDLSLSGSGIEGVISISSGAAEANKIEMRIVHGTVYFSMPATTGAGKFFKVDPENGFLKQLFDTLKTIKPTESLSGVGDAVIGFKDLGPSEIGGTGTEHYRLKIDTKKSLAHSELKIPLPDSVTSKLPKTYDYNLYVTQDYLIRRVEFDLLGQHNQLDYTDWGKKISIEAPADADLVDAPPGL